VSRTLAEVRSQPAAWRTAAGATADRLGAVLRRPGAQAVVGCGTSWFMAQTLAALREDAGLGPTDAYTPAQAQVPLTRGYDHLLVLSRSGTTTEVLDLVAARPAGLPVTAVVADGASPLAAAADDAVVLDFADETSVVQTRFATSLVAATRAALGHDVEALARQAEDALAAPAQYEATDARQTVVLGSGWAVGLAHEGALKLREASLAWSESYPALEYRHGPIALAAPGTLVWVLGDCPPGLAGDIAATGAALVDDPLDPLVDLVRVQLLALARASRSGIDPDKPRNLTRSVVLQHVASTPLSPASTPTLRTAEAGAARPTSDEP
jgi:fructoselysine-6-P-deglycase FrlB-like protein